MADDRLTLKSIDDYLGPGENRFFSRGYQRAEYDVRDIVIDSGDGDAAGVRAQVSLSYPPGWSSKGGVDQRPHLSTVDALVLGVQMAEIHLARVRSLGPAERASAVLRKAVVRAGGAPQEDLTGIVLSAVPVKSEDAGPAGRVRSTYDCVVGSLRVRYEIEHPVGTPTTAQEKFGGPDEVLEQPASRFFGAGFKQRRHHIGDVEVDMGSLTATAAVHFEPEDRVAARGIDGDRQPGVTVVDTFVVSLQLVQVLLYELDSIRRADSRTLWMMRTVLTAPVDPPPLPVGPGQAQPAEAALTGRRVLDMRGGRWRSVDVRANYAGVEVRCSFAHELPPGTVPAEERP
ncbi:AvrD family protein [Actinoplanes sp. NPDC049596]|uniref:AvrD family protein n=1 Tax=unclassified Actinoplanes TaxID=2626549 RepID=UPI0034265F1B